MVSALVPLSVSDVLPVPSKVSGADHQSGTRGTWCLTCSWRKAGPRPQQASLPPSRRSHVPGVHALSGMYRSCGDSGPRLSVKTSGHLGARQAWLRSHPVSPFSFLFSFPSVLYPNLAELENYMGLSLSSQEVQQSLPQTPESCRVGIHLLPSVGTECSLVLTFKQTSISSFPSIPAPVSGGISHSEPSAQVLWDFVVSRGP